MIEVIATCIRELPAFIHPIDKFAVDQIPAVEINYHGSSASAGRAVIRRVANASESSEGLRDDCNAGTLTIIA
ncbi:hypothetical protein [Sinorhizobium sp. Sb3]|uniref:hypothetical protein n=1 Tax=Sinorhizobium sp. Sb3 TaxID=1358417 RepID=UPI000AFEB1D4|nr:hypothetical protein [Sinorhizobium sp. Sb3]